jgi:hypothetical protein
VKRNQGGSAQCHDLYCLSVVARARANMGAMTVCPELPTQPGAEFNDWEVFAEALEEGAARIKALELALKRGAA